MKIRKKITLKAILIAIGLGIWVIVLQNAGIIPTKQNVYVEGGFIDNSGTVMIDNTVRIRGSVDVDNTVSVSIDEVSSPFGLKSYLYNPDGFPKF